jgi:hypothetical protein
LAETANFQELSAKYGLDPRIMVDFFRAFASHINVTKGNGDVYHEPFKDTCIESYIVIDDCNKHAQILKVLFLIRMLICVEYLDLVNRVTTRKIIVSTTEMKKLECGSRLQMSLVKSFVSFILFFVNFVMTRVILISNAQAIIVTFLIE